MLLQDLSKVKCTIFEVVSIQLDSHSKHIRKIVRGTLTSELFPLSVKRKNLLKDYPKEIVIKSLSSFLSWKLKKVILKW